MPRIERGRELGLTLALALLVLAHALAFLDYFVMPNPDYLDQRETAVRFAEGLPPLSYRMAPLYPAILAAAANVVPGEDPMRPAGQAVNAVLWSASLVLMFLVARRFLRWGAFFVPWLFAVHPVGAGELLSQPLVEPLLLFTCLLAVWLALEGSRWAYVAAALASVARYEGLVLVPAVAALDLARTRRLARPALSGALASALLLGWLGMAYLHTGQLTPYASEIAEGVNPYLPEGEREEASRWNFPKMVAYSLLRPLPPDTAYLNDEGTPRIRMDYPSRAKQAAYYAFAGALWALLAWGAADLLRRARAEAALPLAFVLFYALVHTLYPVVLEKHVFPILWALYLFLLAGVRAACEKLRLGEKAAAAGFAALAAAVLLGSAPPTILTRVSDDEWETIPARYEDFSDGEKPLRVDAWLLSSDPYFEAQFRRLKDGIPVFERLNYKAAFTARGGYAYSFPLDALAVADDEGHTRRSALLLYEDGAPLPLPNTPHGEIAEAGRGRYSHWTSGKGEHEVYFAPSDNSDPNANRRLYSVGNFYLGGLSGFVPLRGRDLAQEDAMSLYLRADGEGHEPPRLSVALVDGNGRRAAASVKVQRGEFRRRTFSFRDATALDPFASDARLEPESGFDWTRVDRLTLEIAKPAAGQTVDVYASRLETRRPKAPLYLGLAALYLGFGVLGLVLARAAPGAPGRWAMLAAGALLYPVVLHQTFKTQESNFQFRWTYGQHYLVGKWWREHARPGDKLLAVNQHIVQYASGLPQEYFDDIAAPYAAQTREEFVRELAARGVTHLVWDNDPLEPTMHTGRLFRFLSDGVNYPRFTLLTTVSAGPKLAYVYKFEP